jgi:hydrogenase maturation protease
LKPILVLCLGNDVLTDDAFGFRVGEALDRPEVTECADVRTAAVAGFALLDILEGRRKVLIVDTVVTGEDAAGTVHFFPRGHWTPSRSLVSSHQISLPNALQFGRLLGYDMPEDIDILAVEASDVTTLSEEMTPLVAAAVPRAAAIVEDWIRDKACEVNHGYGNTKDAVA